MQQPSNFLASTPNYISPEEVTNLEQIVQSWNPYNSRAVIGACKRLIESEGNVPLALQQLIKMVPARGIKECATLIMEVADTLPQYAATAKSLLWHLCASPDYKDYNRDPAIEAIKFQVVSDTITYIALNPVIATEIDPLLASFSHARQADDDGQNQYLSQITAVLHKYIPTFAFIRKLFDLPVEDEGSLDFRELVDEIALQRTDASSPPTEFLKLGLLPSTYSTRAIEYRQEYIDDFILRILLQIQIKHGGRIVSNIAYRLIGGVAQEDASNHQSEIEGALTSFLGQFAQVKAVIFGIMKDDLPTKNLDAYRILKENILRGGGFLADPHCVFIAEA